MLREEYAYSDIADYLYAKNDLLIVGPEGEDERSRFFYENWNVRNKMILRLIRINEDTVVYCWYNNGKMLLTERIDLCLGIPRLLRGINAEEKNILIDMSSLDHVLIMYLTKVLIKEVIPRSLFASYIRPEKYSNQSGSVGFSLSDQILAVQAVPGFTKREKGSQVLCAFLGFEGMRLNAVLETVHNVEKLVPIVAFPSGAPQWYNVTMWNSMDTLQSECKDAAVRKCSSESVFEAVDLLKKCIRMDEKAVLVPLGTRPHSMACAIFASIHPYARIIYDYVIEHKRRAIGISKITVYHLSSFLNT